MPERLVQVALEVCASLGAEDRYQRLVTAVHNALPADAVMLLRRSGELLVPLAACGLQPGSMTSEFPVSHTAIAGDVSAARPHRTIGDVGSLLSYTDVPEAERRPGILLGVPLMVEGELIGALHISARDVHAFDELADETVILCAALAATALRAAGLMQQLEASVTLHQKVAHELQRDARKRVDGPLAGSSPGIEQLREQIQAVAAQDHTVLLVGPPGSPKEAVARTIHASGPRRQHTFIHVQCALRASQTQHSIIGSGYRLIGQDEMSTLGKLDLAAGGTLFLDGVEHLSADTQRALGKLVERYAGLRAAQRVVVPDVRLLISTGVDFSHATASGRLVEGLAAALKLDVLRLPGLSERQEDIPLLVNQFVRSHARRIDSPVREISAQSIRRLTEYEWPGDVEEMNNVLGRAVAAARSDVLEIEESLLLGGISLGSYTLIERLADGGMGEVWLATHKLLSRPAAVKVIRPEMLQGVNVQQNLRRFLREARATANLRSIHTIEVYDFGISEDGAFFYVMERLHGLDLETLVQQFGPMPPERALRFLKQACRSLSEAHEAGLVHRDIKPANLFAGQFGHDCDILKVLDFGIVTTTEAPDGGPIQGTPGYIAPEAARAGGDIDLRADIYGLGCVAFWLLTGFRVFERDNALQVLMAHVHEPPPLPSSRLDHALPSGLDELIAACLHKDPQCRPANAEVLYEMLAAIEVEEPWTHTRARDWWRTNAPEEVFVPLHLDGMPLSRRLV